MPGGRQSAFISCEHESGTLACRLRKVAGQDQRFSMKMMFASDHGTGVQPVWGAARLGCSPSELLHGFDLPEIRLFV